MYRKKFEEKKYLFHKHIERDFYEIENFHEYFLMIENYEVHI